MKKYCIVIISILTILSLVYFALQNKESNKTFMQDGILFAMTKDGEEVTSFPTDGKYKVKIDCKNGKGNYLYFEDENKWKFTVEDITGKVSCNVDFTTVSSSDLLSVVVSTERTSGTGSIVNEGDAGFRYEGQDPNNYIWFNNELWRIIGVIPTKVDSSGTTENLVKIIRNESIGGLAYDAKSSSSGSTGAWGSNTLYSLLNEYYFGKKDGTNTTGCYGNSTTAKAKCDYTEIGINGADYYGSMIKKVYWNTGASAKDASASEVYETEKAIQTVYNYVGLMSASDYGYATSVSHSIYLSSCDDESYTLNNWLYGQGYEWTSIQYSSRANSALCVDNIGAVDYNTAFYGFAARPVLYLGADVYVSSGDGSKAAPFILVK